MKQPNTKRYHIDGFFITFIPQSVLQSTKTPSKNVSYNMLHKVVHLVYVDHLYRTRLVRFVLRRTFCKIESIVHPRSHFLYFAFLIPYA